VSKSDTDSKPPQRTIPLITIGIIVLSFGVGVLLTVVATNALKQERITMATDVLITFIATVGLGVASIFLAVVAINLSRQAEEALIRRSDEGIRLQTDTYLRTNDVLTQIQTSTGMTEKRIEDIIAGRAKLIVSDAVDRTVGSPKNSISRSAAEKLKAEISDSLRSELVPLVAGSYTNDRSTRLASSMNTITPWMTFQSELLKALTKLPDVELLSSGSGNFMAEDIEDFWDAVLTIGGLRVGIDARLTLNATDLDTSEGRHQVLERLVKRAREAHLSIVFLVFDLDTSIRPPLERYRDLVKNHNNKTNTDNSIDEPLFIWVTGDAHTAAARIYEAATNHSD